MQGEAAGVEFEDQKCRLELIMLNRLLSHMFETWNSPTEGQNGLGFTC